MGHGYLSVAVFILIHRSGRIGTVSKFFLREWWLCTLWNEKQNLSKGREAFC